MLDETAPTHSLTLSRLAKVTFVMDFSNAGDILVGGSPGIGFGETEGRVLGGQQHHAAGYQQGRYPAAVIDPFMQENLCGHRVGHEG